MDLAFKKSYKILFFIFTFLVFAVLYCQATNPSWKSHLEIDTWVWYQRIDFFRTHGKSFAGLEGNEILPATLLFLFIPAVFSGLSKIDYGLYLKSALGLNLLILLFHVLLCKKQANFVKTLFFLLVLLLIGPIMLFRFDAAVTLLVLLSIWFFKKKNFALSGFSLGWAFAMKIFPIIFLPYFLLVLWFKPKNRLQIIPFLAFFTIPIILSALVFLSLGSTLEQITEALNFHSLKYVSIESIPGSLLTAVYLFFNKKPLPLLGGYGLWGVKSKFVDTLGLQFFNYLWILPVGIFYLFLIFKRVFLKKLYLGVFFWTILLFLVFSKNLHPQYIFWFIAFFPFLKIKTKGWVDYLAMFFLLSTIALLNQNIYPRLYTAFIENFYYRGQQHEIFYLQLLRNLSIVLFLIYSFRPILLKKTIE